MKPLELEPETVEMLADIVYQTEDPYDRWLASVLKTLGTKQPAQEYLNRAGLARVAYVTLQGYAMSLRKVLAGHCGLDLVEALLQLSDRWVAKGLDPVQMQRMTVHCWNRLKQARGRPRSRQDG